jgi:hypothetical protein
MVSVDVTVLDPKGMPDPFGAVQRQVFVEGRDVTVKWRRNGARVRATVAAPNSRAPWDLTVVVTDDLGTIAQQTRRFPAVHPTSP